MKIAYSVHVEDPNTHLAEFVLELEGVAGSSLDLVLPSWVPGSYHIQPFARNFRPLRAVGGGSAAPLAVEKVDKARWRVRTGGEESVTIRYAVYGHEIIDEGLDVTDEHLFVNAALCLPFVDGHLDEPYEVELHVPSGWRVVTELAEVARHPPRFRAATYDELVDSPIDCGTPNVFTFSARGVPHRVVLCGRAGNFEAHRLEEDLGKIVEATIRLFGETPLDHYTFFYHLTGRPDGGLEHGTSTSIVVRRDVFRPEDDYRRFLSVTSHEYFHLYNVKRIRPRALGPFDYTREVHTRQLWWMEGTTDYYGELVLRRAGLVPPRKFLESLGKEIRRYLLTPGRSVQSLEDASFNAWIDAYQPYEESRNQSISYYLKGALVSLCLDLTIRHRTENERSLDTVLRTVWQEYGRPGRPLEEGELLPVANRATGLDLTDFFGRFVSGTAEIDFPGVVRWAGLKLEPQARAPGQEEEPEPGYLGVETKTEAGFVRVTEVLEGSPARRAGVAPGDEIVALDDRKLVAEKFPEVLKQYPPGTPIDLTLFRRGLLTRRSVTTGSPPPERYTFTPADAPSELEKRIYEGWLGVPWESAKKSG